MMISIRALTKQFSATDGQVTALKSLDVDVAEGEFFVIVGASGSGKTTLLRCVAGLETPERGEIWIDGQAVFADQPPTWVPTQRRKVGMVFQSYAVWPHLTVYENVALPLAEGAQRVPRGEVASRVHEALRLVQLDDLANRSATLLSGGQQQRVALARAIAVNSRLLLMDEPLSNLDARLREEVRGKIRELAKRLGSTVLYVTHDQVEAMAVADKIALMRRGELLQVGSPMSLYRAPARAEVAEFFGQVNWLGGRVVEPGVVETAIGPLRVGGAASRGEAVLVGFRPEALTASEDALGAERTVLAGTLTAHTFLGDQFLYTVLVCGQPLVGKGRVLPSADGGRVRLQVAAADVLVFPAAQADDLAGVVGEEVGAVGAPG
ncbi:MAG TPA: ABC transporter ATP-binding protein [Chloroflexota bacterium]|nr:ABC transporter ATP-binding protein [Chloroflexota bacterium]